MNVLEIFILFNFRTLNIIFEKHGSTIEVLELTCDCSNFGFKKLDECKKLKSLKIFNHGSINSRTVKKMLRLTQIQNIEFIQDQLSTFTSFKNIFKNSKLPKLKKLKISNFDFDDETLFDLPNWFVLKFL
jgi:hypothetical protein